MGGKKSEQIDNQSEIIFDQWIIYHIAHLRRVIMIFDEHLFYESPFLMG
jgi:hypothetical protein